MKFLKNLFKGVTTREPTEEEILKAIEKREERERIEKEKKLEEMKESRERMVDFYKDSDEPWIHIFTSDYDKKEESVKLDVEWNDAMIRYLKDNKITGENEDVIIQKYLNLVYAKSEQDLAKMDAIDPKPESDFQ